MPRHCFCHGLDYPSRERIEQTARDGHYLFWLSTASRCRWRVPYVARATRLRLPVSIYTPAALRSRGYADSVSAANVERIFAEVRKATCLYTDLRNPMSNRCYAKIGFGPVCAFFHDERKT